MTGGFSEVSPPSKAMETRRPFSGSSSRSGCNSHSPGSPLWALRCSASCQVETPCIDTATAPACIAANAFLIPSVKINGCARSIRRLCSTNAGGGNQTRCGSPTGCSYLASEPSARTRAVSGRSTTWTIAPSKPMIGYAMAGAGPSDPLQCRLVAARAGSVTLAMSAAAIVSSVSPERCRCSRC